jgi:hypothetical protein
MVTIDAQGLPISLGLFIRAYQEALKLAPGRFLTLRLNPLLWDQLESQAEEITHVVHSQEAVGPLGKKILKVACVPAPNALGEGIAVERDKKTDPGKMSFEIHGTEELVVVNIHNPVSLPPEECRQLMQ